MQVKNMLQVSLSIISKYMVIISYSNLTGKVVWAYLPGSPPGWSTCGTMLGEHIRMHLTRMHRCIKFYFLEWTVCHCIYLHDIGILPQVNDALLCFYCCHYFSILTSSVLLEYCSWYVFCLVPSVFLQSQSVHILHRNGADL